MHLLCNPDERCLFMAGDKKTDENYEIALSNDAAELEVKCKFTRVFRVEILG